MPKLSLYVITLFLLLSAAAFPQPRGGERETDRSFRFYSESFAFPSPEGYDCYVTYRIPFNNIVFIMDNGSYAADYTVNVEIADSSTSGLVERKSVSGSERTSSFESTNSNDIYSQGYIRFKLRPGLYRIMVVLTDHNSKNELRGVPIRLEIDSASQFMPPLILNGETKNNNLEIANFAGAVPFTSHKYDLLIPIVSDTVSKLYLEIYNNNKLISETELDEFAGAAFNLEGSNRSISLTNSSNGKSGLRYFLLKDFNKNLKEGVFQINLRTERDSKSKKIYSKPVIWFQKPFSLTNFDFSIDMLKYLADEKEIKAIEKTPDDSSYVAFFKYWKKYDPTPETEYNELMNEYYKRADHALRNFSGIGKLNGAESDMGKIYILYGEPAEKRHYYTNEKLPAEVWIYKNPPNQFVFIDRSGAGDYKLEKS